MAESNPEPTNTRPQSLALSPSCHMATSHKPWEELGQCPDFICVAQPVRAAGGVRQVPGRQSPAPGCEEAFPTTGMKTDLGTVEDVGHLLMCNTDWHLPTSSAVEQCSQNSLFVPSNCLQRPDWLPEWPIAGPAGTWTASWGFGGALAARPPTVPRTHSYEMRA